MDKTTYWDEVEKIQKERDCTIEEQAEIDARRSAGRSAEEINREIMLKLESIDKKSIRALREGDAARIDALESEASELRLQLIKE